MTNTTWKKLTCAAAMVFLTELRMAVPSASVCASGSMQNERKVVHMLAERFRFSPDEVRVKVGTTIEFRLESDDTDHGFRIIGTDIERVIPKRGRGNIVVSFTPDQAGRYDFECSKLCGAGHNFMHGVIVVEP
ncbi:MAG TPA: cupredoxin domain-containing protein [Vicinamibacterales bacterium]